MISQVYNGSDRCVVISPYFIYCIKNPVLSHNGWIVSTIKEYGGTLHFSTYHML